MSSNSQQKTWRPWAIDDALFSLVNLKEEVTTEKAQK